MGSHSIFCILIGYLIFRSTFLPRVLGGVLTLTGLGWLTYLSPAPAKQLSPWIEILGLIGEASVFLWLPMAGVNAQRWRERAVAEEGWRPRLRRTFDPTTLLIWHCCGRLA
jgi:hypothetical protein